MPTQNSHDQQGADPRTGSGDSTRRAPVDERDIGRGLVVFLAGVTAIAFLGAVNPWDDVIARACAVVLIVEVGVVVLIGCPVFLYHLLVRRASVKESFGAAVGTIVWGISQIIG